MPGVVVRHNLPDGTFIELDGPMLEIQPRFDSARERALVARGRTKKADESGIEGSGFAIRVAGETGLPIYVKQPTTPAPKIDNPMGDSSDDEDLDDGDDTDPAGGG